MKQDQMSMAASIESRVPFLDDDLVEYVAALPGRLKLRGWETKAVLRAAVGIWCRRDSDAPQDGISGSPRPMAARRLPVRGRRVRRSDSGRRRAAISMTSALQQLADEHRPGRARHGDRLWLLINLEIWHRIFCEGEQPADVMRAGR